MQWITRNVLFVSFPVKMKKNLEFTLSVNIPFRVTNVCQMCGVRFDEIAMLKKHNCEIHRVNPETNCDQCDYRGDSVNDFITHLLETHEKNTEMIECQHCDHRALTIKSYNDHLEADHVEFSILNHLVSSQKGLSQNIENFKTELTNILNVIIDDHNAIKQELFILRQDKQQNTKKIVNIEQTVMTLSNALLSGKVPSAPVPEPCNPPSASGASSSTATSAPQSNNSLEPVSPVTTSRASASTTSANVPLSVPIPKGSTKNQEAKVKVKKYARKTGKQSESKMLFVGDSIIGHADINAISAAVESKIVTTKAYSAVYDDVSNNVKEPALFPKKNFLNVVPNEVTKDNYEHMIVQTGSVDITNLKTDVDPNQYLEYFKQEAVMSAKNIFNSCVLALERQPSLKSVIIMKQTPRYDPREVDPLSLKSALSHLFNNTLMDMWMSSSMKEYIFVGSHNIDCSGAIQSARYRHTKTGRFDGVHLYGSSGNKAYTRSVLNILRSAKLTSQESDFHLSCPQSQYQKKQSRCQGN